MVLLRRGKCFRPVTGRGWGVVEHERGFGGVFSSSDEISSLLFVQSITSESESEDREMSLSWGATNLAGFFSEGTFVGRIGVTVARGILSNEILCCFSGVLAVNPPVEPLFRWNELARGGRRLMGVTLRLLGDGLGND